MRDVLIILYVPEFMFLKQNISMFLKKNPSMFFFDYVYIMNTTYK